MKNFFWLLLLLSFVLVACDTGGPRRRTALYKSDYGKNYVLNPVDHILNNDRDDNGAIDENNIPAEFSNCDFSSFRLSDAYLGGGFNLCRSKSNTNRILLQLEKGVTEGNLCVIPTASSGDKSTYLGGLKCFSASSSETFYQVDLEKNRPGFTEASINGVMIMKDIQYSYPWGNELVPDAYLDCMNMLYLSDQCFCTNCNANRCAGIMSNPLYGFSKFNRDLPYPDLAQAICSTFKDAGGYVYRDI